MTNMGIVLPIAGYHDALRRISRRHGTLLIIDETHTFSMGVGGCTQAWGLDPDIVTIGKCHWRRYSKRRSWHECPRRAGSGFAARG